jgi:anaerobic selenocysteine-containing dehydrogenase
MFDFFKKKKEKKPVELKKDPFPDYNDVKENIIIDIRNPEDVEFYGKLPNSINIPFDEYFASKLMMLDKSKKYAIMDDRDLLWVEKQNRSLKPDSKYPFLLITTRLENHWHSMTKTGQIIKMRLNL